MSFPLFEKHRAMLDRALTAIAERGYWTPYPESPSPRNYGEGAVEAGKAAFDALLDKPFELDQPGGVGTVGSERSPYGFALGVRYPKTDLDVLFGAIGKAQEGWRKA
ncbi:MAG: phenylacetic acid degradation protein PaaN, partial [Casimicrobiaceae bacterium]